MSLFKPEIAAIDINLLGSAIYYSGLKILGRAQAHTLFPELYLVEITRITGIEGE